MNSKSSEQGKTAIEELIEWMDKGNLPDMNAQEFIRKKAAELLAKENQQTPIDPVSEGLSDKEIEKMAKDYSEGWGEDNDEKSFIAGYKAAIAAQS